jgi:rSAM/selenodomain-associated transferase 2
MRGDDRVPRLSVVVPTLDEAAALPRLLDDLAGLQAMHEVVVADGGSQDGTVALARERGARVVETAPGRGTQLAAGARAARGKVLCFLHADVRLGRETIVALERLAAACPPAAHAFTLAIDAPGRRYRWIEWGTARRSRLLRLPYGDQGLVLPRALYERAGGFPPIALMEDVALVRALGRLAPVVTLPERVHVSPRRWERDGALGRTLRNWLLLGSYLAGASPDRLARRYRPEASAREASQARQSAAVSTSASSSSSATRSPS